MTEPSIQNKIVRAVSASLGLRPETVDRLIRSAPVRYKVYTIPKRKGGDRVIAQPSKEVKAIQRIISDEYLSKLPVHECATAYMPGASIRKNANVHRNCKYLLKMDVRNFFNSIKPRDLAIRIRRSGELSLGQSEIDALVWVSFWRPRGGDSLMLSVGAPSSPLISNVVMFEIDEKIWALCEKSGVKYSRYADDMTFSTVRPNVLTKIERAVVEIIQKSKSPALSVNDEKTYHGSKKYRRMVTGVVIANDRHLSIGRERKRSIRAQIHKFALGKLHAIEALRLKGSLAFAMSVEPKFVQRMRSKYGVDVMTRIQTFDPRNAARPE